jgi:hypothetical protein
VVLTFTVSLYIDIHIAEGALMIFKIVRLCLKQFGLTTFGQQVLLIIGCVAKILQ